MALRKEFKISCLLTQFSRQVYYYVTMYHSMDVIGISGPPCSGKDVAAEYLSKFYGYKQISTGDLLREKAKV